MTTDRQIPGPGCPAMSELALFLDSRPEELNDADSVDQTQAGF